MPEKTPLELAVEAFEGLHNLANMVKEHQVFLLSMLDYLQEQPSWDSVRFGSIFDERRKKLNLPVAKVGPAEVLLEVFKDLKIEGPAH